LNLQYKKEISKLSYDIFAARQGLVLKIDQTNGL